MNSRFTSTIALAIVTTGLAAAQNDECAGATPVILGTPTAFDTAAATTSVPAWPCALGGSDLWFSATTTTANVRLEVSTCGSSYDTAIEVFSGTCAGLVSEGCNDDSCGLQSEFIVNAGAAGTTYFIRVGGFNSATGPGTLTVTELPPASISQFSGMPPNATGALDFDNPFVASGAISGTDATFTNFGIAQISLVGGWTAAGDAMTVGSNVAGQGLVSDLNGTLTVAGPGEPLDTPGGGAGFDIVLAAPATQFGVLFVDQIGFTYDIELLLNGVSYGTESYVYGPNNVFPEPGHYWSTSQGVFDQVIILFQNAGGVGIDEIAFDSGTGTLGTNYCNTNPNSTGATSVMSAVGSRVVASNDVTLIASDVPMNTFGFFITSSTQGFVANPNGSQGNLCVLGAIGRYVGAGQIQNSMGTNEFSLMIDLTQTPTPTGLVSVMGGETRNYQAWHRDVVGGTATSNFTDGLEIMFL